MRLRSLALQILVVTFLTCVWTGINLEAQTSAPQTPAQTSSQGNSIVDELNFWNAIKDSKNPEDFNVYLKKFPNGEFADLAKTGEFKTNLVKAQKHKRA
jgi:hypothetical protein